MYGHPALVTEHARALASSPRAFNWWFWKQAKEPGLFPESLLPSPASRLAGNQAGGSLHPAAQSPTAIGSEMAMRDPAQPDPSIGSEKISYLGSKAASGAYQVIVSSMPAHDTYIETHRGTGAVLRQKQSCGKSISLDLDAAVFNTWPSPPGTIDAVCDCVDYLDSLNYAGLGRVLIYADPPYVLETRTSAHRYKYDYGRADHVRLIECLRRQVEKGAMVMLSGYRSELYDELVSDWRRIEFQAMTRGGVRTECLWLSFSEGLKPHWHDYAGLNFTDRQRIKRKAERWANNYASMPPGEQSAVLSALLSCRQDAAQRHKDSISTGLTGSIPQVAVSSTTATKSTKQDF